MIYEITKSLIELLTNIQYLFFTDCYNNFDGTGYTCVIFEIEEASSSTYRSYLIHFLSNGAVTSVDYFETDFFNNYVYNQYYPIFYGGNMVIGSSPFNNTLKIDILYNNGSKLEMFQEVSEGPQKGSRHADILQKQNIILYIRRYDNNIWIIDYCPLNSIDSNGKIIYHIKFIRIYNNLHLNIFIIFLLDVRFKYQNPNIYNTYPNINENIETNQIYKNLQFVINYNIPVTLSSKYLTIYQYDEKNHTTQRQTIPGSNPKYCKMLNDTAVSFEVLASILHQDNARFGIRVDNDFVKSQITKEQLLGISEEIWTITTCKYYYSNKLFFILPNQYFFCFNILFFYFFF